MDRKDDTSGRHPFELSANGWSFFAIGVAFFIIGISGPKAFMAIGIVFMVLAFGMGHRKPTEGDKAKELPDLPEVGTDEDRPAERKDGTNG